MSNWMIVAALAGATLLLPACVGSREAPAIRTATGDTWTVRSVAAAGPSETYNLTVARARTYYVGEATLLAHNTSPCGGVFRAPSGAARNDCVACSIGAHYGLDADTVMSLVPDLAPARGSRGIPISALETTLGRAGLGQGETFSNLPALGREITLRAARGSVRVGDGFILAGANARLGGQHAVHARYTGGSGLLVTDLQNGGVGAAYIDNRQPVTLYALPPVDHGASEMTRLRALSRLGPSY